MKILVFGLGALGTVYACLLQQAGHKVSGIDIASVADIIRRQGVQVRGIWGEHQARLCQVESSLNELTELDFDLIIITVKAYETAAVSQLIKGYVKDSTYVLLAQNGYGNYEAAVAAIPASQLILSRVIFGAVTVEPGVSQVTVIADDVLLGHPQQSVSETRLHYFADTLSHAGIPTRVSLQIMEYVWAKIIYNSALNPLGAILEVPYGKLAQIEWSRQLMDQIIEEIFAVLKTLGQSTPWADAADYRASFYGQMLPSTADHRASMLQDIQRGRKTEIDALNGAVVDLGRRLGVPTPVNNIITTLLKSKEALQVNR
ncbi:MAG: ketopantoate reductase family protein [Syntrophomonadaceae bacterium]|jgi:2-dehydropantoate 2-reductase